MHTTNTQTDTHTWISSCKKKEKVNWTSVCWLGLGSSELVEVELSVSDGISAVSASGAAETVTFWFLLMGLLLWSRMVHECRENALGIMKSEVLKGLKLGIWEEKEEQKKAVLAPGWIAMDDNIFVFLNERLCAEGNIVMSYTLYRSMDVFFLSDKAFGVWDSVQQCSTWRARQGNFVVRRNIFYRGRSETSIYSIKPTRGCSNRLIVNVAIRKLDQERICELHYHKISFIMLGCSKLWNIIISSLHK